MRDLLEKKEFTISTITKHILKLFQTRLQALSVIVNSRSSKEIFSPDELNLLEVSIPNFMILINPADRQDFVNLVKKVNLEHEFAILSKTFVFFETLCKKFLEWV
jgi:hypothetical protein